MLLVTACENPALVDQWCPKYPKAVAQQGEELLEAMQAADVPLQDVIGWVLDDTPTDVEHRVVLDAIVRWRSDEPAAYERACSAALAAPHNQQQDDQIPSSMSHRFSRVQPLSLCAARRFSCSARSAAVLGTSGAREADAGKAKGTPVWASLCRRA